MAVQKSGSFRSLFILFLSLFIFASKAYSSPVTKRYDLDVAFHYFLIRDASDIGAVKNLCWTSQAFSIANKATPTFRLVNSSSSLGIKKIKISFRKPGKVFFGYTFFDRDIPEDFAFNIRLASPSGLNPVALTNISHIADLTGSWNNYTRSSSSFEIAFNGRNLAPGEEFYFETRTTSLPGFGAIMPPFTETLWDKNGSGGIADNAVVEVTYSDNSVLTAPFDDYPETPSGYQSNTYYNTYAYWYNPYCDMKNINSYHGVYYFDQKHIENPTPTYTPTKTNTSVPTHTATRTATRTPTRTNTSVPTYTATQTATRTPTRTNTSVPTYTATRTATNTPSRTQTATYTPTRTNTATRTNTPVYTNTVTATPTRTFTPTRSATWTPTRTPTATRTSDYQQHPVIPAINCAVRNSDGTTRYYLGYTNQNSNPVTIQSGINTVQNKNILTINSQQTQVQPSTFEPGTFKGEFNILTGSAAEIKWTVQYAGQPASVVISSDAVPECQPVTPVIECADILSGDIKLARVGYDNRNDFRIEIPVGSLNRFNPAPADRGQPGIFLSGRIVNNFSTTFSGTLEWFLGSLKATANANTPSCTGNNKPICEINDPSVGVIGVSCQGAITNVQLGADYSYDPDGGILSYLWTTDCSGTLLNATSPNATIQMTAPGNGQQVSCKAYLTVNDGLSGESCQKPVSVLPCSYDCPNRTNPDVCGVCGGNGTTCLDCLGIPNGGARLDKCGVCNGNNVCLDCAGVPNGSSKYDRCGVCGGNGSSCLDCVETDIKNKQFLIDNRAFQITKIADKLAKNLTRTKDPSAIRLAAEVKKEAHVQYKKVWGTVWSFSSVISSCANTNICPQSDNLPTINSLLVDSQKLTKVTQKAYKKLKKLAGTKRATLKQYEQLIKLDSDNKQEIKGLPRFSSNCS